MLNFFYKVKLKLETDQNITILNVLEDVAVPHAAILRAGLAKLIDSGKKTILVDLTNATFTESAAIFEITGVTSIASERGAQIVLVSPIDGVGHATTREAGIAILGTNVAGLMASEARLQNDLERLKKKKGELEEQFNGMGGASSGGNNENDPKELRKDNADLRNLIAGLEKQIEYYLKGRTNSFESDGAKSRNVILGQTLTGIFEFEGVLK